MMIVFTFINYIFQTVYIQLQLLYIIIYQKMHTLKSESEKQSEKNSTHRSNNLISQTDNKLFITNLSAQVSNESLNQALRQLFQTKCKVNSVDTKKHFNHHYSFAFVQIDAHEDIDEIIEYFNRKELNGKRIKVEKQLIKRDRDPPQNRYNSWHNTKRTDYTPKKDLACFFCQVIGHIARNCPNRDRSQKLPINNRSSRNYKEKKKQQQQKEKDTYRSRDERYKKRKPIKSSDSSSSSSDQSVSSSSSEDRRRKKQKRNINKRHKKSNKKSHKKRNHSSSSSSSSSPVRPSRKSRRQ